MAALDVAVGGPHRFHLFDIEAFEGAVKALIRLRDVFFF
jgi:hypothetical protein